MNREDIKLLDCTLRDGGYVNGWNWGSGVAKEIIYALIQAKIDIVEVGFLRDVDSYDPNVSVCNLIEELNNFLPEEQGMTMFSAMAMRSNYDINKLTPYSGKGIELIRVTAHDYDIMEGMEYAQQIKEKGYKLSINPINIMGYSDEQILQILREVNKIKPYQFSIVDTFGSMKRRDLDRIVSLIDNNLDNKIRLALHLHENMSLSCSLVQNFLDKHLQRKISIDGSLMGMGRTPGNLPIELIADYLNDYFDGAYDIDYLLDAIQDYIACLKGDTQWGYTPAYFLSARFNLHRNYAEFFLDKGDLTHRDINHILFRMDRSKSTVFDKKYADRLYREHLDNRVDDSKDIEELRHDLRDREILVMAPGASINDYCDQIENYILENNPVVISVNFIPTKYKVQYAFFGNNKRLNKLRHKKICKIIVTSNLHSDIADFIVDYNSTSGAFEQGGNSLILLLKLLYILGIRNVTIAGADGYVNGKENYYDNKFHVGIERGDGHNLAVSRALKHIGINLNFLTPSLYNLP